MPYKINPVTGNLDYYEASGSGSGANLTYTPSPTNGVVVSDTGTDATILLADGTNAGLMTAAEKTKLAIALVEENINYIGDYNNGASYTYDNVVSIPVGSPYGIPGQFFIRVSNPGNPGYPPGTSSWDLLDIYTGSPAFDTWIRGALQTKVTVEVGKGLSTNDYTTTEQTKLAGIAASAEVNVNADWNATSGDAQILNKPAISGTNTGDNAVNTLYSGLATSKQDAITLTTTGTSGAATLSGNTLNIPQYSGGATTNVFELKPNYIYRGITINNNSTTVTAEGGVVMSSSASNTAQSVASTNFATKQIRLRYYATSVTGGRYTGTRGSALLWYIQGGFHYVCDFNISDTSYSAGCQQFYGMAGQTTDLSYGTSTPILVSTLINIVGVGNEVGDTNLQVFHNDATGTASKIDLGIDFPANRTSGAISTTFYSVHLYNTPSSTDVHYKVTNNETGVVATGVVSTNLPLSSQGLNFFASRSMAATSVTSTGQFDLSKLGVYSIL